ncbi:MAG: rhomboid family intramembrane serine protease [Deltaproteobacteria bacterium]|nr:rhomboid family intramembrane serine protease [Deltaproteobacteria bacterium]
MIPIRDINPRVRLPVVNYGLLLGIGAAFVYQLTLGSEVGRLVDAFGFVPARALEDWAQRDLPALLTSGLAAMFLHGGWFHVIGNLLYLRVFGDNVEDRLGHLAFLLLYLLAGIAGWTAQGWADPNSSVPVIGASGAIAGVLGAYIVLFPSARIVTLFPVFIFLTFIEVPAMVFLGIWGLQQLLNGYLALETSASGSGVAWFAHLGGFGVGLVAGVLGRLWRRRRRKKA